MLLSHADDNPIATLAHHARASRRLRLEISTLIGNAPLARAIEAETGARPGVTRVVASPWSGRVLIEYATDAPVLDALEQLGRATPRHAPVGPRRADRVAPSGSSWHAESTEWVAARLMTSATDGLTSQEARQRLATGGANVVEEEAPASRLRMLARQLANVPTAMLIGSAIVSILLGDLVDASAIVVVVGLNAAIGYRVERRSEDLLAAWRVAEIGRADVIRDGSLQTVAIPELVPGDLLVVRAGAVIGADARVIEAHRLATDEAALTGESEPVTKSSEPVAEGAALAARTTMLYRGTSIASGHGRAIVVATADGTEIAKVQRLAATSRAPQGRLHRRLTALSTRLAWSGIAGSAIAAVASFAWRRNPLEILRDSVALGVAAIPEGLPVAATAALVRAMARMRAHGIVVRRLATAETLGGVTVACTDKTGTLTENRMRLETISMLVAGRAHRIPADALDAAPGTPLDGPLGALVMALVLNSDVEYHRNGRGLELEGSSTERALIEAAQRAGIDPVALRARWPRQRLIERRDDCHYVISEHDHEVAFIKGAPEQVVPLCDLDAAAATVVQDDNAALAGDGARVLAVGWQALGDPTWHYLGLIGLRDPLRAGSVDALDAAARAGIRTIILTGDQRATAEAIARQARLAGDVIEGADLPAILAAPDAADRLRRISVIARVAPADKVAVVEALRQHGEIVAMMGDGINDAPALRAADVGIAVGAGSTDLARQTADIVLEHPDLRAVLAAVSEGRAVQDNLRRSIRFQAAGNLGEVALVLSGGLVGQRLIPSLGLLWINLLTDTLPGLALALEPGDAALLARPPRPPAAPILDRADWRRVARDGSVMAAVSAIAAIVAGPLAAFATIGASQFGYAAACRAADQPLAPRFAVMIGGSAALHLLAVASTPARALFGIAGGALPAITCFGIAMGAPLYLAWRRQADHEICRASPSLGATPTT